MKKLELWDEREVVFFFKLNTIKLSYNGTHREGSLYKLLLGVFFDNSFL